MRDQRMALPRVTTVTWKPKLETQVIVYQPCGPGGGGGGVSVFFEQDGIRIGNPGKQINT